MSLDTPLTILGINGSLRKGSYNRMALVEAQKLTPADTKIDIYDLHEIPLFNQDQERTPPAPVADFKKCIRAANAILFATPEYNYSVPGVLKNAIDWASRPLGDSAWKGKPVALISAAHSLLGGARAQYHLRQMLVFLDMHPVNLPEVMIAQADKKFDADGNLNDETARKLMGQLLQKLVEWSRQLGK